MYEEQVTQTIKISNLIEERQRLEHVSLRKICEWLISTRKNAVSLIITVKSTVSCYAISISMDTVKEREKKITCSRKRYKSPFSSL
jgi:hypothetical protein